MNHAPQQDNPCYMDYSAALLAQAPPHVIFDGWSIKALRAAAYDADLDNALLDYVFPRGGIDAVIAFLAIGDRTALHALQSHDLSALRVRERVALAVRLRLQAEPNRDVMRRTVVMLALPMYAGDAAQAFWHTADTIWTGLNDSSQDYNWYSKRAILSCVYSSTLLFWLGDDSPDYEHTHAFLDRRIDNVMAIEKIKARARSTPIIGWFAQSAETALNKYVPPPPPPPPAPPIDAAIDRAKNTSPPQR